MGYMMVIGNCFSCGRVFGFNADHVPSVRVNADGEEDPAGKREPICRDCIEYANPIRVAEGRKPLVIHPDAYEPSEGWQVLTGLGTKVPIWGYQRWPDRPMKDCPPNRRVVEHLVEIIPSGMLLNTTAAAVRSVQKLFPRRHLLMRGNRDGDWEVYWLEEDGKVLGRAKVDALYAEMELETVVDAIAALGTR